jgi:DeoR/GlpR family transcriptional regulator of sugar metabolism
VTRKPGRPAERRDIAASVSELVLRSGTMRVADLSAELGVSEVTIRKTLAALEKSGVLTRFHGEARAYDGDAIPFRMHLRYEEKRRIALLAATLVEPGDTVLVEAGSAAALLAERLKTLRDLTVITPNLFIARIFRGSRVRVVVVGGAYQEESESLVGPLGVEAIASLGFSKAFLGVSGFTPASGFTLNDFARAELSRAIIGRGAENWILTDSTKFGAVHSAPICEDLGRLRGVVTDAGIPQSARSVLEAAGLRVLA